MQHGCEFVNRKYSPHSKDGVVTNNTSESVNNIVKTIARYQELPTDTDVGYWFW